MQFRYNQQVRLTPRETEVAQLVCDGFKDQQIAERLSISECTVKSHLQTIFDGLRINSRTQLTSWCWQHQDAILGREWAERTIQPFGGRLLNPLPDRIAA